MLANYFEAGSLIKDRIECELKKYPTLRVFYATGISQAKDISRPVPAVHVIYYGDTLATSVKELGLSQVEQQWLVVLEVRNVRDTTGQSNRESAGEIFSDLFRALQGWKPSAIHGVMLRKSSPLKPLDEKGFAYFPFLFSTKVCI